MSEPLDLAAVAAAHPSKAVTLDLSRIDVSTLLSVGDVVDMAAALGVKPQKLLTVLDRPEKPLDVIPVLAWIIARKGDRELTLEEVRTTWRIEVPGEVTVDPTPAAAPEKPPSKRRRTSSASPA